MAFCKIIKKYTKPSEAEKARAGRLRTIKYFFIALLKIRNTSSCIFCTPSDQSNPKTKIQVKSKTNESPPIVLLTPIIIIIIIIKVIIIKINNNDDDNNENNSK